MTKKIEQPEKGVEAPPGILLPEIMDDLTRRDFLIGAGLIVLAPGCGSGEQAENGGEDTSANTRTIEHKYGSTEISGIPERVVSVGLTDQDTLLALGVAPVAVRYWFGEEPNAVFPWARDELGDADPQILNMPEINFEGIAALEPDLISGMYSGITEREYELLSEIAPTVAQSGEYPDFGMPWQETTTTIGRALNREDLARKLVAELEERFATTREEHLEFVGSSIAVAYYALGGIEGVSFVASQDPRARFFINLGFEIREELEEVAGGQSDGILSNERMDLLEAAVLVWGGESFTEDNRAKIDKNPLIARLDVMEEGRAVYMPSSDINGALHFSTVLSLPTVLDNLVPMLAAAIDGDPETKVEDAAEETTG